MANIEKRYKEWLSKQPLEPKLQRDIDQQFMVDFNYNSNHLEGNTLTYGQTKLLLLYGDTIGSAPIQDYEEMKAHNVGLELMKIVAKDKDRTLSENFIRELNQTILVRDFYKLSRDGDYRYKINVGVYKTRPNSVITPNGDIFDYASPEETPSLMNDLLNWYGKEEERRKLSIVELAALLHYRYIRIHPFEDGNGRIARLLVNYILHRNDYPMIVIRTDDRKNYLDALHQCDVLTGKIPSDGAHATLEQAKPLVDYLSNILENKLTGILQLINGKIDSLVEANDTTKQDILKAGKYDTKKDEEENDTDKFTVKDGENVLVNVPVNVPVNSTENKVLELIANNNKITFEQIAVAIEKNRKTAQRTVAELKKKGIIERIGADKNGYWKIKN
jgi:Fic family protein